MTLLLQACNVGLLTISFLLSHADIPLMGFGFCLALLGLGRLFCQDFQGSLVFLRFAQSLYQRISQLHIGDSGNGQTGSADYEAHLLFGAA